MRVGTETHVHNSVPVGSFTEEERIWHEFRSERRMGRSAGTPPRRGPRTQRSFSKVLFGEGFFALRVNWRSPINRRVAIRLTTVLTERDVSSHAYILRVCCHGSKYVLRCILVFRTVDPLKNHIGSSSANVPFAF